MNECNSKKRTYVLSCIAGTLIASLGLFLFSACSNAADGSGAPDNSSRTYTVGNVNFKMLAMAAATDVKVGYQLNTDERDPFYNRNNPPHTVSVSAYFIGETEVTQELWKAVTGVNSSAFTGTPPKGEIGEKRPAETLSWFNAVYFCNELTKKIYGGEGECVYSFNGHVYNKDDMTKKETPVMDMNKKGFRLPTEAEWECAAKGGTENRWAGTNDPEKIEDYSWANEHSNLVPHQVQKKLPNEYGLYDMTGNVSEWCWDWLSETLPTSMPKDYTGALSGEKRILRGLSSQDPAKTQTVFFRNNAYPNQAYSGVGLRLVCRP